MSSSSFHLKKIELAVANYLPTKRTYGVNAKTSLWPGVSTLAKSFSKANDHTTHMNRFLSVTSFQLVDWIHLVLLRIEDFYETLCCLGIASVQGPHFSGIREQFKECNVGLIMGEESMV